MRRPLLAIAAAVAGLLGVAALLGARFVARLLEVPDASGRVVIDGLATDAHVLRDRFGVPHVDSQGLEAVFTGLGFAHAQDRLFQMELLRRSARGTLSELFGRSTLDADRLSRTLGLADAAEREAARLDPEGRALLEAYSRGVNAWIREIRERRAPRPLEFAWLDLDPDAWDPADSIAIVRLRAWMLGRSLGASLLLDRLVREIGGVASEPFFPERPSGPTPDRLVRLRIELGRVADSLARATGMRGPVGSLGFVISPASSRRGFPLLVNDPHVQFQLPPVFYLAHLRTPTFEATGATWPGIPVFWTGATRTAAWGQVALHANVSDLFEETLKPDDPNQYDVSGRWVRAERRDERIGVRGSGEEPIRVVSTRHGPLLASVLPADPAARTLALHWSGQHRDSGLPGLMALPWITSWDDLRDAVRDLPAPPTIFLYADRGGDAGIQVAGHLPLRAIETGLLPVPGRTRWYDWRGTIPFEELPYRRTDEQPWIVVGPRADKLPFPVPVSWLWSASGAVERIEAQLTRLHPVSLEDALAIQRETRNGAAVEQIRRLLELSDGWSAPARRVRALLESWDGSVDADAVGPAVYHTFKSRILRELLGRHLPRDRIDSLLDLAEPVPGAALVRYLERSAHAVDPRIVNVALEQTWSWLSGRISPNPEKWAWGRIHRLELVHPFARLGTGATRRLGGLLGRGPRPVPGDPGAPWTMHADGRDPFRPRVGPAFRFAVDLGDPMHAHFGLAGGQSGLPGARTYADGFADWLRGEPRVLWMRPSDVAYHSRGSWDLVAGLPAQSR